MPHAKLQTLTWSNSVHEWIASQLMQHALIPTGPLVSVRSGLTAEVLRVPTDHGVLYFKATTPPFAFEARLTAQLAAWQPDHLPRVYSVEPQRGWLLLEDVGEGLRAQTGADGDFSRWELALRSYAALQQSTTPHADALIELGVPDRRLHQLPALYDRLIADEVGLRVGTAEGITPAELERLRDFRPKLVALCEQLAAYHLPDTLHHDDFHDNNVALTGGRIVFFDWGECGISHPFMSMMIALRVVKLLHHQDTPLLDHLRDTYLSAWTAYGPLPRLHQAFTLAHRLAYLVRALTWQYVLDTHELTATEESEEGDSAAYFLRLFLNYDPATERYP
jgi:hypothetical protein